MLAILLGAPVGGFLALHSGLSRPLALAGLITFLATVALARDLAVED